MTPGKRFRGSSQTGVSLPPGPLPVQFILFMVRINERSPRAGKVFHIAGVSPGIESGGIGRANRKLLGPAARAAEAAKRESSHSD